MRGVMDDKQHITRFGSLYAGHVELRTSERG